MQHADVASDAWDVRLPPEARDAAGHAVGDAVGQERTAGVATMILNERTLEEIVFALRTALGRVLEEELGSPTTQTQWRCVQQWLSEADAFVSSRRGGDDFVRLKAFPLTGTELRALQTAVDQAEQNRAAQQVALAAAPRTRPWQHPESPHQSLARVHLSSLLLAVVLGLSLALNVTWLTLFRLGLIVVPHLSLILGINSVVAIGTFAVWSVHHWHLLRHMRAIHWHLPLVTHFLPPRAH